MRLPVLSLIALSCLVAAPRAAAQGADLYVDAAATTTYEDGTPAYPFHGIQDALDAAQPGDVVNVLPGVYYGTVWLADQVRLVSVEGPALTVIDGMGSSHGALQSPPDDGLSGAPRSYVEGFTVRNGQYFLVHATNNRSFWGVSYFDIHGCVLEGDGSQTGMYVMPSVRATVTRSEFRGLNRAFDVIWSSAYLDNLTVHDVDSVYFLYEPNYVRVQNNNVTQVANVVERWGYYNDYTYVHGSNNNFFQYELLGKPDDRGLYPVFYWTANLSVDPLYSDPAASDYRLQDGSPLIDAGIDVGLPFSGAAPDVGAYETDGSVTGGAEGLAESFAKVSGKAYLSPEAQRRNAMTHKLLALLKSLHAGSEAAGDERIAALQGARQRLLNDIWAKADGHFGGQSANDWILTYDEQARLKAHVDALVDAIDAELATLGGQ